jgi:hypothetical protein
VTGIRTHEQKITFSEMRAFGVRDVLIYCVVRCSRHIEVNADDWPENVRLSDVSSRASPVHAAARKALTSGRSFHRPRWVYGPKRKRPATGRADRK